MIDKLIYQSRTTEVDAASTNMNAVFKENDWSADTHLSSIFASLETEATRLNTAIRRSKAESELDEKDEIRDEKLRAFHYLVVGFMHHPDPAIKSAAEIIETVFDKYGLSLTGESYATESSLINSLISDLGNPDLQASIVLLSGCAQIIENIKTAQENFAQTHIAYEAEKAEEGTLENASTIKKEVVSIINNRLVVYLRAMEQVDEATYGEFARTLAQIIADNNQQVKKRRKRMAAVA